MAKLGFVEAELVTPLSDPSGATDMYRAIHEVHYESDGRPVAYSATPATIGWDPSEGEDDPFAILDQMGTALAKPALTAQDFQSNGCVSPIGNCLLFVLRQPPLGICKVWGIRTTDGLKRARQPEGAMMHSHISRQGPHSDVERDSWIEQEVTENHFQDARLARQLKTLLGQLPQAPGQSRSQRCAYN